MHAAFQTHRLTEQGMDKSGEIARAFDELLGKLQLLCEGGRELAVATTHLETACFFAKKAMAKANTVAE
jgi:hypothetical protein